MAQDHRRKTVRDQSRIGRTARRETAQNIPGREHLPDRPLFGQGDRTKYPGSAFRQRHLRAALEPQLHRFGRDLRDRNARGGKPGQILRGRRSATRYDPKPPDATDGLRGDGKSRSVRPGADPRRNRQSVPRHPPLLAHGNLERRDPGAIHWPHGRRYGTTGLPGRERCCRRLDDRDLCGDETLYRQLALGRRALLFLHGQADGRKEVGDRDQLQIDPDANVCRTMLRQFLQQTDDPDSAGRRHYA